MMPFSSGEAKFRALSLEIAKSGAKNPDAVASAEVRKKLGKDRAQDLATKGREKAFYSKVKQGLKKAFPTKG